MAGVWSHQFEVMMRPLRTPDGPRGAVRIEARTAAQAGRMATASYPELKVVSVRRCDPMSPAVALLESRPESAPESNPGAVPRVALRRLG